MVVFFLPAPRILFYPLSVYCGQIGCSTPNKSEKNNRPNQEKGTNNGLTFCLENIPLEGISAMGESDDSKRRIYFTDVRKGPYGNQGERLGETQRTNYMQRVF